MVSSIFLKNGFIKSNTLSVVNTQITSKCLTFFIAISLLLLTSSCVTPPNTPEPQVTVQAAAPVLSAKALDTVSVKDIRFAQAALLQLGFKLGRVDGIWGKRSQLALIEYEKLNGIESAGGALSALNLYSLSQSTKVKRDLVEGGIEPAGLAGKLDTKQDLSKGPQLIIVDKPYAMRSKANPYSELLAVLQPGTGVYIISKQAGWYEVESLERVHGYIQEN